MDLLHQPAPTAARTLLSDLLDTAAQCAARLDNREDREALHDYRVALRRLRANQRAYREQLGIKLYKRVRRLARATNVARDREVQLDWLRVQCQEAELGTHSELDALIGKLEQERAAERQHASTRWQAEFADLATEMRRRLKVLPRDSESVETFALAASAQLQVLGEKLRQGFKVIEQQGNDDSVHAARIIGKRLRYLVEPLVSAVPGAPMLIKRLKALQDLLGEIHDCQVRLDDFAGRHDKERADQYATLRRHTAARRAQLLDDLQAHWLGEHAETLFQPLQRVIDRLKRPVPVRKRRASRRI